MSLWDLFKSPSFKAGPLTKPHKFTFRCSCRTIVDLSIPKGMAEPSVLIQCPSCGKGEVIWVER